ncbi:MULTISPECIES: TIGR01457 family HAD-type hydrolase [Pontibacillus]|uniref:Acid sugar phosphatase n=1 Tax=Pontibacillus chungwhensis TaxID=265426 RepID=A0ABY8UW63_9BACI|nr:MULTISPECIES: TIGR01457 family HAD-type hydrolase [Pontibacillus]MCD5325160.1 TIGR01457 family HAD-type hydrolase [Pontibacillus sp. HN14]WIF97408.1 TIGR01457 family HAD-type hydrolase [Pontibacillus chungwhensis]
MDKTYKGYLIDLDGTMYRGTERVEAASDFVKALREKGIPHLFVTNNSSRRPDQVADKLNTFDIPAEAEQIYTTSMATASYIRAEKPDAKVYAMGEVGLMHALENEGLTIADEDCDYVVMGMDRELSYEKFAKACLNVRAGATFLSTNGDIAIPTERGMLPGNGSITSVVTVSTGVEPTFIGKPESIIMEQAMQAINLKREETLMVGDNYHTDILAGINAGMDTLHVQTGVTTKEQLSQYDQQPTYTIQTLDEWIPHL